MKSQRLHIGIFGKTNVGKSSFLNKITNQDISVVSPVAGTTTDVVEKTMEFLPVGPVVFLDTAGVDDTSLLSEKRIEKTNKIIPRIDVAVIICDYNGIGDYEKKYIDEFAVLKIPYLIVVNKTDEKQISQEKLNEISTICQNIIITSVRDDSDIVYKFKNTLIKILPEEYAITQRIVADLIPSKGVVVLVTPIDKQAPKGRLILPQVQVLRDLLDGDFITVVVKETELVQAIFELKNSPVLVITDSQAFKLVNEVVPKSIPLTSFSILLARLKGDLKTFVEGAYAIDSLKDGDKVLVLESCTHHAIEDDIGNVKIPNLVRQKTGKNIIFEKYSGHDMPKLSDYKLIIHCGACMTNRREVLSRILLAHKENIPITNYGIAISYCLGILDRAIEIFD